jgi:hypothetical protein
MMYLLLVAPDFPKKRSDQENRDNGHIRNSSHEISGNVLIFDQFHSVTATEVNEPMAI